MGDYFGLFSVPIASSFEPSVTWIEGVSVQISLAPAFANVKGSSCLTAPCVLFIQCRVS